MPVAETGIITDIRVTALQSSSDTLLNVAQSNNPLNILSTIIPIVNSIGAISMPKHSNITPTPYNVSKKHVTSLRQQCEAMFQNLVLAIRSYAGTYDLSPVSPLDAASELELDVRENARLLAEHGHGYDTGLQPIEETRIMSPILVRRARAGIRRTVAWARTSSEVILFLSWTMHPTSSPKGSVGSSSPPAYGQQNACQIVIACCAGLQA
ncbi:hypothetical protein DL93DRAFT_2095897 [Clavulina sp. PMI_390]|nr:hypothetical protein DL93DRAFT_2095897 [Clavulina sp. PMI_390]